MKIFQFFAAFLPLSDCLSSPQLKERCQWRKKCLLVFSPGAGAQPVVVPPSDCWGQSHLLSASLARLQHLDSQSRSWEFFLFEFIFLNQAPWQTAQSSVLGSWSGCCWTASSRFRFSFFRQTDRSQWGLLLLKLKSTKNGKRKSVASKKLSL